MENKSAPSQLRFILLRMGCAVILLLLAVGIFFWRMYREQAARPTETQVVAPTCTESGYTLRKDLETGHVDVINVVDALGHRFGEWDVLEKPQGVHCGRQKRICSVCSLQEEQAIYPELAVVRLSLTGSLNGIGKKSEVDMTAVMYDGEQKMQFDCFATLKYQGHESLSYDKKNYTLKLYRDEKHEEKLKLQFSHWNKENKYILKANYIDPTSCRNLVCADVWAELCKTRDGLPKKFADLSNYGAVDGFPVALYINDRFEGLYTMNLHKDDDLFGMKDGEKQAIMIANNFHSDEALFREPAAFGGETPWEVEYCGTEDQTWAKEGLNRLIGFVMTADDETFRTQLERYLDVDSAVDYLIAVYALGLTDNGRQNLVLVSYDSPWTASLYDMETAFGLNLEGTAHYEADEFLPVRTADGWDSATGSLLWDRLLKNFEGEIRGRYAQLRQDVLEPDALCGRVNAWVGAIPNALYQAEWEAWPREFAAAEETVQITEYIRQRIAALDVIFMEGEPEA